MKITILTDNEKSWVIPFVKRFVKELKEAHDVMWVFDKDDIEQGDIAIFLSCEKIVPPKTLALNKYNLVVHSSDLPKGKGFSPLTWQILEGKDEYVNSLFEADEKIDNGVIYAKDIVKLEGHELIDEIRRKDMESAFKLLREFISKGEMKGIQQEGEENFYERRTVKDSELDIDKSIKDQFNLLRVADNERYPAFFIHKDKKYFLKVFKDEKP